MSATFRRYLHEDGHFQAFVVDTTLLGQAAFQALHCSPVTLQLLTQAMTGALLLAGNIKSEGTLLVSFRGDGPLGFLNAEANTQGEVRGTAGDVKLKVDCDGNRLFREALGGGTLAVKRRTRNTDGVYESIVEIVDGEMAYNLAHYLLKSEQVPAAIQLGAELHPELGIAGAGGILIQAMPGADQNLMFILESRLQELASLASFFREMDGQDRLRDDLFEQIPVKDMGEKRVRYFCPCDRQKMFQMLATIPMEELESLRAENIQHTVNCSYCGKGYPIIPEDLDAILEMKRNPA